MSTQRVTRVVGVARIGGKDVVLEEGILRGIQLQFRLFAGDRGYDFTGTVNGDAIDGSVQSRGAKEPWSAVRAR
jgi:hypothetical protein